MQSPSNTRQTTSKLRHWLSDALFTGRTAADYFAPLLQAIDPDWTPGRALATVESIHAETLDTKTFVLRPSRGWQGFQAGQHVAVEIEINGRTHVRTFTVATTPTHFEKTGTIALTIKETAGGRVTPYLHRQLRIGAKVSISSATGAFLLPDTQQATLLYLAAGSGITPVMSHLRSLLEQQFPVPVTLLYYARRQEEIIFLKELQAIANACPRFKLLTATTQEESTRALQGRVSAEHIEKALLKRMPTQIYICGPRGFAETARTLLSETAANVVPIVSEHFGGVVATHDSHGVHQIRLQHSERALEGNAQKTLLETAENNGLSPQAGCRMGICHTCKCKKTEGRVRNVITGEISDDGEEMIQLCISTPETDITLDL